MGYIPPIRDEQSFQYFNRLQQKKSSIKPLFPVAKGEFQEILSKQEKLEYLKDVNKGKKCSKTMKKITGKGYYIDEVV